MPLGADPAGNGPQRAIGRGNIPTIGIGGGDLRARGFGDRGHAALPNISGRKTNIHRRVMARVRTPHERHRQPYILTDHVSLCGNVSKLSRDGRAHEVGVAILIIRDDHEHRELVDAGEQASHLSKATFLHDLRCI